MKQSAAKSLGVAALGAAFAATGAGAANAAPAVPDAGAALDTVTRT
ncbi:ATP-binding protein, partial [Streptomyces nigra]